MVMETTIKTAVLALAGWAIVVSAAAQTPSSSLAEALSRSLVERIQAPLVFSTRDTAFALSLPQDEPAEVYVRLTVGKNGKVKEKLTRVDANHLAGYVAPAFVAATKDLRIDRSLLGNLTAKDTALTLALPLVYQCVYDTINKAWPGMEPKPVLIANLPYKSSLDGSNDVDTFQRQIKSDVIPTAQHARWIYQRTSPTRVWYYLAFLKNQEE